MEMNGHATEAPAITGDPQVIRAAQHLLQLAQSGAVVGVCLVGITTDGNIHYSVAIPQSGAAATVAIGGLEILKSNLTETVKKMQSQANVSRILKPTALHR